MHQKAHEPRTDPTEVQNSFQSSTLDALPNSLATNDGVRDLNLYLAITDKEYVLNLLERSSAHTLNLWVHSDEVKKECLRSSVTSVHEITGL
jgi:hypothetical protein